MKINPALANTIKEIRETSLQERAHSRRIVQWTEEHRLRSGPGKALVCILPTRGCSWALSKSGGCSICGYIYDNPQEPNFEAILKSFNQILKNTITETEKFSLKLFTSGSFLDEKEIPKDIRKSILKTAAQYSQIEEIILESRPEYVTATILEDISKLVDINKVEIAIGLESANNKILKNSINKGFYWEDFVKATDKILAVGARVKAYLLFKPPFISEYDSIIDILESVTKLVELGVDTVSINAISIHRGTLLSQLFEKDLYRTPWLWSLLHLCKTIKNNFPDLRLICDVVAGGSERGSHNCGKCDKEVIGLIKNFTLTQDTKFLNEQVVCECKVEWKSSLFQEKITVSEVPKI